MLDRIVEKQRKDLQELMQKVPLETFKDKIVKGNYAFSKQLKEKDWALIAECKLVSPAKGVLCSDKTIEQLAKIYEENGASVLSVHTNEHFSGRLEDLRKIKSIVSIPVMRKDFIVDEYQVYEAAYMGADAVLLIARILTQKKLKELLDLVKELGMDALVEVHDVDDVNKALQADAPIVGINNRNLENFTTNIQTTIDLKPLLVDRMVFSESGIKSKYDLARIRKAGVKGALIGEGLVTAYNIEEATRTMAMNENKQQMPDGKGRFGKYGGRFVPETVIPALLELEEKYLQLREDKEFQEELKDWLYRYAGRPTRLYRADNLTAHYGKATIYLKREDLMHTGAHKINNAIGQALVAKQMGKERIVAETGAGQHGVAVATVCALFGLKGIVYMGEEDMERQRLNVFRMRMLGTEVRKVTTGTGTLKDATSEAIRDWVTNIRDTHYILGTAAGPHPYPMMVRDFQTFIGEETKAQAEQEGLKITRIVACVGGGSNAIGMFYPFRNDTDIEKIGVEAGGYGLDKENAATINCGKPGVLHGAYSYLMQNEDGQVLPVYSISAGLDYPGVGPEHAFYNDTGIARYVAVTDAEAIEAFQLLTKLEGIIPAVESSHALAYLNTLMPDTKEGEAVILCLSGRGDKDVEMVEKYLGGNV